MQKYLIAISVALGICATLALAQQTPVQNPPGVAPSPSASLGGSTVIGTTPITGGVNGQVLFDNNGVAGEYTPAQLLAWCTVCAPLASPSFTGVQVTAAGSIIAGNAFNIGWSGRGTMTSPAAGRIQLGLADAIAPVAQTLQTQSVTAGQTNVAGALTTIAGSKSTGSGGGDLVLQSTLSNAAATVQNTLATGLTVKGGTQAIVVANVLQHTLIYSAAGTPLPTCNAGAEGTHAAVSDATAPTYLAAYVSGGAVHAPVYCDGTSWKTA